MWHGCGRAKPEREFRALKQVRKGRPAVLCYHSAPERSLYSIAESYAAIRNPDPHDSQGKKIWFADLRAFGAACRDRLSLARVAGKSSAAKK